MSTEIAPERRGGLAVVRDTVVAPDAAFEALRRETHWVWAFGVVCVLGVAGALLQIPAGMHVASVTLAHQAATDPTFAAMSAAQRDQAVKFALAGQRFAWLFFPPIVLVAMLVSAGVFTVANAVGRGQATFARLFGLAANVAIVNYGIAYLLIGILASRLGADAFSSQRDLFSLLPSLAAFVPADAPKLAAFLATFNPFGIWSFVLIGRGLRAVARVSTANAYVTAAVVAFGGGTIAAALAR